MDKAGSQSFRVTQNASGVWVTFPVVGDETHPVVITAFCPQSEHRPSISAVAFDPFEDRRTRMLYRADGYLGKVIEPTSDPEREVCDEYFYNDDGTIREVRKGSWVAGELVDSRETKMFYGDSARNLTRVEDPLNGETAPTLMEYDQNSNMIHLVDPDEKEMFFQYDYRRRLVQVKNGLDHTTTMVFDGRGLLTSVVDAKQRETQFLYKPSRQLWKITNALNETTEFTYFADGLLKSIKDPANNEVFYQYDDADRLVQVVYPESNLVMPDFSRDLLTPKLRMAYDVWERLVAMTSPNGNLEDTSQVNLIGALNVLRNSGAERENGIRNQVPLGWQVDNTEAFEQNATRTSAQKLSGDYSLPLGVPSTLSEGESIDWVQRRPGGTPGGRYLMKGSAKSDLEANFKLRAVVREFSSELSEQTAVTALSADTWGEISARLDLPGDAQISRTMPALHQFRAGLEGPASGTAQAYVDELQVRALSQVSHYNGEYAQGSTGPDGAQTRVERDRYGRVRRVIDAIYRAVDFRYDHLDRILRVTDSQGLSLQYEWDFLGNLLKFTDSRAQDTLFEYDLLSRVKKITQPDTGQFELFDYTPAGDLASYTNCRGQERQFFYDAAHRLVRIDYLLDPNPNESVAMQYDAVGNLTRLTERNGDRLLMTYDKLNRLQNTSRVSGDGPSWTLANQFDSRGNRIGLKTDLPIYGGALLGTDRYATEPSTIFSAEYNSLNQMTSLTDSADNETQFAFDADGRLAEVNHPLEDLQTRYRYDLVGKLLESRVTLDSEELFGLNYEYNLAGERLRQTSRWEDGGNCFEYQLDDSGRLVQETINRFVVNSPQAWANGSNDRTAFGPDGKLRLLAREDDFAATYLDLQRWELVLSEPVATSVQASQNQGLRWLTSSGDTFRNGRHMPPGSVYDSSSADTDYPYMTGGVQVADTVGWFEGRILLRHRLPLEGAFDVQISVSEYDVYGASIGLGVTRDRFETAGGASRFPTDFGGAIDVNGCDIVIQKDGDLNAKFNDETLEDVTVTKIRLKRFLDGSDWKLQAYYHDGDDWVTDVAWVGVVDDQELYAYLHLSGKVGYLKWSDFLDTVSSPYPVSAVGEAVYESRVYDAGHSVDWTRIAWNEDCPTGTDVSFQLAVSENADGPWTYAGPSGGSSYFTTAAGETITSVTGRYARFKLFLESDGADTPVVHGVQITHSGTSGSRVTTWTYDQAGNITQQARVTDVGTETDVRTYNNLNQLTTSSGGWTYQFDEDGNLIGKNNGTAEDCEKWEFS